MDKKIGKLIKKVSLVLAATVIVAFLLMIIGEKIRSNIIKENEETQEYQEWLAENCECLVKEKIYCPTGFEIINQTCKNENEGTFTSRLIGCSEYDCSGEIKLWNNETEKWENKTE